MSNVWWGQDVFGTHPILRSSTRRSNFRCRELGMPLSSSFMVHFWKVMVKGLDSATCYQILINFDTNTMKIRAHQCSTFEGIVFWVFPTVKAKDSDRFCTVSARVSSAAIKCSLRAEETCRHIKFCKRIPWYNLILYPYQSIFTVARRWSEKPARTVTELLAS